MNRQFPGRNFHPLVSCTLVAHQYLVFFPFPSIRFFDKDLEPGSIFEIILISFKLSNVNRKNLDLNFPAERQKATIESCNLDFCIEFKDFTTL